MMEWKAAGKAVLMSCWHALQVADDEVYLVVNAGCREKDLAHIGKHLEKFQVRTAMPTSQTSEPHMQRHLNSSCAWT